MATIGTIIAWLMANWASIAGVLGTLVGAASTITAATPSPKDDSIVSKVKDVLGYLSVLTHHDADGTLSSPGLPGDQPLMYRPASRE